MKYVIALVVIILLVLGSYSLLSNQSGENPGEEDIGIVVDFVKTGNIVKNNPGMEGNVWHIVFDNPGAPADSRKLSFDGVDGCSDLGRFAVCDGNIFYQGNRVSVEGDEDGGTVLVKEIKHEDSSVRDLKLYYYSPDRDKDAGGNIMCSKQGLVGVNRSVNFGDDEIGEVVRLLLTGYVTEEEKNDGIETEYPLSGLSLLDYSLDDGVATLTFSDPENKTVGGSCRVSVLWGEIEETVEGLQGVESVRFMPLEIFQP